MAPDSTFNMKSMIRTGWQVMMAATLALVAGGCAAPAKSARTEGKPIEARAYALKSGAVIYLPDSVLAVNRETDEVLLQRGYVRLESKERESPVAIKLRTYGTVVEC